MSKQYLVEGLDPTSLPNFTVADLLPFLRGATPASDIGFIILSATPPDVVTYPELSRFIWLSTDPSDLGSLYYYNGISWSRVKGNVLLPDASVNIGKLSTDGGTPGYIIAVKNDLSGFEFKTVVSLIQGNTLNVGALAGASSDGLLSSVSGTASWKTYAEVISALASGSVPITKLTPGTDGYILVTSGSSVTWQNIIDTLGTNSIPLAKIQFGTQVIGYSSTINLNAALAPSFFVELEGNVSSFSISNLVNGGTINVILKQDSVGGHTVAFDTSIKWPNGSTPTVTATANKADLFSFCKINGTIFGVRSPNYSI